LTCSCRVCCACLRLRGRLCLALQRSRNLTPAVLRRSVKLPPGPQTNLYVLYSFCSSHNDRSLVCTLYVPAWQRHHSFAKLHWRRPAGCLQPLQPAIHKRQRISRKFTSHLLAHLPFSRQRRGFDSLLRSPPSSFRRKYRPCEECLLGKALGSTVTALCLSLQSSGAAPINPTYDRQ
jgi:hypothetical protein